MYYAIRAFKLLAALVILAVHRLLSVTFCPWLLETEVRREAKKAEDKARAKQEPTPTPPRTALLEHETSLVDAFKRFGDRVKNAGVSTEQFTSAFRDSQIPILPTPWMPDDQILAISPNAFKHMHLTTTVAPSNKAQVDVNAEQTKQAIENLRFHVGHKLEKDMLGLINVSDTTP